MDRTIYRFDQLPMSASTGQAPGRSGQGIGAARRDAPRIGVIYNPRSHRNKGQDLECTERPDITVAQPREREDIAAALAAFAADGIDYLIINGGDGTVRDVLTMGQGVFGDAWPALAILPKGKTNALNVDLGAPPGWNLPDAIAAFANGKRIVRRPLSVAREGGGEPPMLGFIFGAGAFTLGIETGQDAHALGFFNSLAVGATGAWGVMQALFGSDANKWRRGTEMSLAYLPSGEPVERSAHGDPARRSLLLASTLAKMPLDIKLFAPDGDGIKLALLDKPRRRILASVPAILLGWRPDWLAGAGFHQLSAHAFSLDVGEPVILDGEAFPAGRYLIGQGPELTFVTP
ncbi:acylglycerol kinase family protein [Qipengyuania sp. 6B39]|uniref:diacylglycerol/lipid kinase family protein n=1 Tax=Qipengyuania proteolytica TaxID=2867239 RepID=UPI001C8A129F|nr:acylglycerol kinase family protein [Qipengyuania proteolytica]MBX7494711.1 acylglycerol kinase family protein [Qipengyuania proteolytica]